ncbi:MAG TPA: PqqD family protein [Usitatibacter sp.]|nr:PqqD family protein [Usitatibacter sp.]
MKLSDKVTVPAHVMSRQVGEEYVMLDLAQGVYFGLDPVGARLWQLLCEGMSLERACAAMLGEYDVPRAQLESDVLRLAEELAAQGLIEIGNPGGP